MQKTLFILSHMAKEVTKTEKKQTIKTKVREECLKRMQEANQNTEYASTLIKYNISKYFPYPYVEYI